MQSRRRAQGRFHAEIAEDRDTLVGAATRGVAGPVSTNLGPRNALREIVSALSAVPGVRTQACVWRPSCSSCLTPMNLPSPALRLCSGHPERVEGWAGGLTPA